MENIPEPKFKLGQTVYLPCMESNVEKNENVWSAEYYTLIIMGISFKESNKIYSEYICRYLLPIYTQ
jgi:hypothetical protein